MRLFVVFLILAALPMANAQEGLFVSRHNVTYTLGENDFSVNEVIVFGNRGSSSGSLFRENIYFTRGNAQDVEVSAGEQEIGYFVEYLDSTVINLNLVIWRGENKQVTINYNRSDLLFSEDTINIVGGLALGTYPWIAERATVKFIAPPGNQFGSRTPSGAKTIQGKQEVLTYDVSPIDIENLTAIKEGLPVSLEYAKYDELAAVEIKTAREFIEEAEFDVSGANKSAQNAKTQVKDTTQILSLLEIASTTLQEAKNELELAQIKSNEFSTEYNPYQAYHYAKESRTLSRESSRKAEEAKDLANYETQLALEARISGIGSKLDEQADTGAAPTPEIENLLAADEKPWAGYGLVVILVLAVAVIFDIYRRSGGQKALPSSKKGTIRKFRAIDELKHKSFKGFDKKLDTVKHGTGLAVEIRDMRKKKEELEFEKEKLQRKLDREEITRHQFDTEKEEVETEITNTSARIDELKSRLNELKRTNK